MVCVFGSRDLLNMAMTKEQTWPKAKPRILREPKMRRLDHTLCMNYVIAMFLLVSYMNAHNHLSYFARFCARSTLKIANKNLQEKRT